VAAEPGDDGCAGPSDGLPGQRPPPGHGPPVLPAEWQDTATHPLQPPLLPPSWVQAIFNTLWLMQQLSSLGTPAERRALLTQIAPRAPFQMPLMTAVPFSALRGLGRLPRRDTSVSNEERGWQVWTGPPFQHGLGLPNCQGMGQWTLSCQFPPRQDGFLVIGLRNPLQTSNQYLCPNGTLVPSSEFRG